jgi:hypothetical protein
MDVLFWLENTSLSVAVREAESLWGYGGLLIIHGMGMAVAVGLSTMIGLRLLGVSQAIPLAPLQKFFRFVWAGFGINAVSGAVIMICHATTMFTNWVMYTKLASVIAAITIVRVLQNRVFRGGYAASEVTSRHKVLAATMLILWCVAIIAGRLTAYFGALIDRSMYVLLQ